MEFNYVENSLDLNGRTPTAVTRRKAMALGGAAIIAGAAPARAQATKNMMLLLLAQDCPASYNASFEAWNFRRKTKLATWIFKNAYI